MKQVEFFGFFKNLSITWPENRLINQLERIGCPCGAKIEIFTHNGYILDQESDPWVEFTAEHLDHLTEMSQPRWDEQIISRRPEGETSA